MFVRLILVAESEQAKWMLQQMRMPYFVHWNDEIEEIKRELNDSQ